MKPVAVIQYSRADGAGYFATFLENHRVEMNLIRLDQGESSPQSIDRFAGLCLLGGPMSVNDPLPWISQVAALARQAVERNVPVIGHCLGGQLLAKTLGGAVQRAAHKEIGWHRIQVADHPTATHWFGDEAAVTVFQWHGETFEIPRGGVRLAASALCRNQAFAVGPHIGLQCHIEMTSELVQDWCESGSREIEQGGEGVQGAESILDGLDGRIAELHGLADRVYSRWMEGF